MNESGKTISGLQIVEWNNERVITTEQLALAYGTETDNIKHNFRNNINRFIENEHYFYLEGDSLSKFKNLVNDIHQPLKFASRLYLWTRKGASRHCKILDTDQAWKQFDILEENYFKMREKIPTGNELLALAVLEAQNLLAEKDLIIKELEPKANYAERIIESKGLVPITLIAKDYGMSAYKLNKLLSELRAQYKINKTRTPYAEYQDKGYVGSKTYTYICGETGEEFSRMHTEWTQKGRFFLYELLKAQDILPLIERNDTESKLVVLRRSSRRDANVLTEEPEISHITERYYGKNNRFTIV